MTIFGCCEKLFVGKWQVADFIRSNSSIEIGIFLELGIDIERKRDDRNETCAERKNFESK